MRVVNNRFLQIGVILAAVVPAYTAHAQYFSSSGRAGHYAEFFLDEVQDSGIEQNKVATVITSSNRNLRQVSDYVVNCNDSMPQVVNEDNNSRTISLEADPSSAEKLEWELWYAVCKKEFTKLSKRSPVQKLLLNLRDVENLDFDGIAVAIRYQPLDYGQTLSNLVSADFVKMDGRGKNPLLIHCDADNATVHWIEYDELVGAKESVAVDLNRSVEKRLVSLSEEIWTKTCEQEKYPELAVSSQGSPNLENTDNSHNKGAASKEVSSIAKVYESYILSKEFCQFHYASEMKMLPVKNKLKQVDELAVKHSIDTKIIWDQSVKKMEKDANYILLQLNKLMNMDAGDRMQLASSCEQFVSLTELMAGEHLKEFGGVSTSLQKDF